MSTEGSCHDQLCPDYYGHTYHRNGTTTATLTTIPIYSTKTILVTPPS